MDANATEENFELNTLNESFMGNCSDFYGSGHVLLKVSDWLTIIASSLFLLIGIPGNILTLMVIFRQRKNITSTAIFLFLLAVSDTVFLVLGPFIDWMGFITDLRIRDANIVTCKLFEFLYITSAQYSSWMLIAITIERIISISLPHAYNRICSTQRSKLSGLIIMILLATMNSNVLYGHWYDEVVDDSKCGPIAEETYQTFFFDYWPWIDLTLYFAVPFVVLVVGNAIILFKLIQMNMANKKISNNKDKNRRSIGSLVLLIVGLNSVFLVSITPFSVFLVYEETMQGWVDEVMCTDLAEFEYREGVSSFLFALTLVLSYINPSVNFILYMLSGAKFRSEVKAIFYCKSFGKENAF